MGAGDIVGLRTLVISSDPVLRDGLASTLVTAGLQPALAATPGEARVRMRQRPDLVLLDARMGLSLRCEICLAARAGDGGSGDSAGGAIPILLLDFSAAGETPSPTADDWAACPADMPGAILRWPADAETLLASVARLAVSAREAGAPSSVRCPQSSVQLAGIVAASGDFIGMIDADGVLSYINEAGQRMLAAASAADSDGAAGAFGTFGAYGRSLFDFMPAWAARRLREIAMPTAREQGVTVDDSALLYGGGEGGAADGAHETARHAAGELPLSLMLLCLQRDPPQRFALIGRDICAQKRTEQRLLSLNRTYAVLSKCNEAVARQEGEQALFMSICSLLTELGGHRFAMVSLIRPEAGEALVPVAWSGDASATAAEMTTSWNETHARGRGPTGTAVRTGQVVVRHDVDHGEADYLPWRAFNERLGLHSAIALPLIHATQCFGALSIYSTQARVFDAAEVRLLEDLARQLSFGVFSARAEAARQRAEQRLFMFERAIESALDGIMITDAVAADHPVVYVNPAFTRITGYTAENALGRSGRFLLADELDQPEIEPIRRALRGRQAGQAVLRCYRKDGSLFWNELHVVPVCDDEGRLTHYVSVNTDISERIGHETQLEHLATHDPLTGLANRTLLSDRLRQAIVHAEREEQSLAVFLIDLDRFKEVNDTLGHRVGDLLLQAVAGRMLSVVREGDTVARLGGDEFVMLFPALADEGDALRLAAAVLDALARPFSFDADELIVTPSIGISLFPRDGADGEILLKRADIAMYRVKDSGRNGFCCFTPDMNARADSLLSLDKDLRRALASGELALFYQPKADLYSGAVAGVEALIRWHHPQRGLVPPAQFIPLAEESGIIVQIGEWVLREACRQARAWRDQGLPPLRIAVNLSARQFRQENLVETVVQALADAGIDAAWLELELTESMVMQNIDSALAVLARLKAMGITLTMDDFGTGYSSLGYLKQFPFDVLKIDRSFVQNITSNPDDALIAVAVIAMAHSLHLRVVAEGVENESQMRYLRSHLCDTMQGYYYSKPLPAAEATAFLAAPPALGFAAGEDARPQRTLLLVDDEPDILRALQRLLRRSGYRILTAGSAAEGLELLAANDVQVIVSDQRMPLMTGAEFLGRVRRLYPQTVRMVLSGYTELGALTDAINQGAIYKFITKPWDEGDLREQIRSAFEHYEQQRAADGGHPGGKRRPARAGQPGQPILPAGDGEGI